MFVDLNLSGKHAIVVSQRTEAETRSRQLLDDGARVTILTRRPGRRMREFAKKNRIELKSAREFEELLPVLRAYNPFIVMICTGDEALDRVVARAARATGGLVYVVDRPPLSDLGMVALVRIGEIRVGISTRGVSPAMSGLLRRRIENFIKPEDIQQVRLQGEIRSTIKSSISDPGARKEVIYKLIRDKKICSLLKADRFEEAKQHALRTINQFSSTHWKGRNIG